VSGRMDAERDLVVVVCAISAGIHAALTPAHFAEGFGAGLGFLVASVFLAGLVVVLTRRARRTELYLATLVLAGLIASYALAITSGLPLLHPDPEPVDGFALATKLVEAAGLVAALDLLRHGRPAVAFHLSPKGTVT
jgi:hypothetical protein